MSTTATSAVPGDWAAPALGNLIVAGAILALFALACVGSATRTDITTGFDEPQHISYIAQIQHTGDFWPKLDTLRLIEPQTFQFTAKPNYLDHPPIFYAVLAAIGPKLEGHPEALIFYRLFDVALVTLGLAALMMIALDAKFRRPEFWACVTPLAFTPILVQLAAAVTNDDLAFLGGALALLGAWQAVSNDRGTWLALALTGVVLASWAKLTGLMLTGAMVGAVVLYMIWRRRLAWPWLAAAAFAFALAAAPYLILIAQYGSPVPTTPAILAFVEQGLRDYGWAGLPRKSFPGYALHFVDAFVANWMPTLAPRRTFEYSMLVVPVLALVCAAIGIVVSVRRLWRRQERALDVVVIAGALGLAVNFALHLGYAYKFYAATGWLAGAYPRYYLPLAAVVPLAGLSLVTAIEAPRWRAALLAFLIAGPVVFRIFGAPLG